MILTKENIMRNFDIRNVNRLNSYEWSRCNNDSRSHQWRSFVEKYHGGHFIEEFVNKGKQWKWVKSEEEAINRWIFVDPEGKEHMVSNFKGFCKENQLDDGRMYDTYTGKRNHHKKWKAKKLYGTGNFPHSKNFGRNEGPPARS